MVVEIVSVWFGRPAFGRSAVGGARIREEAGFCVVFAWFLRGFCVVFAWFLREVGP